MKCVILLYRGRGKNLRYEFVFGVRKGAATATTPPQPLLVALCSEFIHPAIIIIIIDINIVSRDAVLPTAVCALSSGINLSIFTSKRTVGCPQNQHTISSRSEGVPLTTRPFHVLCSPAVAVASAAPTAGIVLFQALTWCGCGPLGINTQF